MFMILFLVVHFRIPLKHDLHNDISLILCLPFNSTMLNKNHVFPSKHSSKWFRDHLRCYKITLLQPQGKTSFKELIESKCDVVQIDEIEQHVDSDYHFNNHHTFLKSNYFPCSLKALSQFRLKDFYGFMYNPAMVNIILSQRSIREFWSWLHECAHIWNTCTARILVKINFK